MDNKEKASHSQLTSVSEITPCEESGVDEESHASAPAQSRKLKMSKSPETAHLLKKEFQRGSEFGNRKTLKLLKCIKLKNLVSSLVSFSSLTSLEVSGCDELEILVTPSIAKSMVQLKRMSITDCKKIKEIIACEGDEPVDGIVYDQLKYLRLQCLPSLTSFCSRKYSFMFPLLDELIVKECRKLEIFCMGNLGTPKLQKKEFWRDGVNPTISKMYSTMFQKDSLEELGSLRWSLADLGFR